jgi:hypothetical protein
MEYDFRVYPTLFLTMSTIIKVEFEYLATYNVACPLMLVLVDDYYSIIILISCLFPLRMLIADHFNIYYHVYFTTL